MTPDEQSREAAIRERDATRYTVSTQLPIPDGILVILQETVNDRRDLLALLDAERATVERLRADVLLAVDGELWQRNERARIAAAVRGLPIVSRRTHALDELLVRAAVLAIIEGDDR